MEWSEFLTYAAGPGVNAIVGFALSFCVDYIPGYDLLEPKLARLVFLGLAFVVPAGATALAIATGEWGVWNDWAGTWWPALVSGFTAGFAGTLAHTRSLKANV